MGYTFAVGDTFAEDYLQPGNLSGANVDADTQGHTRAERTLSGRGAEGELGDQEGSFIGSLYKAIKNDVQNKST